MKTILTGIVLLAAAAMALPLSARAQGGHVFATFRDIDGTVSNLALTAAEFTALQKRAQEDNRVLPKATDRLRKTWSDNMKAEYGFDGPATHPFPLTSILSATLSSKGTFDTHLAAMMKKKDADAQAAGAKTPAAPAPAAGKDPADAQKTQAERAALWQQIREEIAAVRQDAAAATNTVAHVNLGPGFQNTKRIGGKQGKKLGDPVSDTLVKPK